MKFSAPLLVLLLGAAVQALPSNDILVEDAALIERSPQDGGAAEVAVVDENLEAQAQRCAPGKYYCATVLVNGEVKCRECAIAVGNPQHKCIINNRCGNRRGSCNYNNGNPFCV